jgi:hypothetical protein
MRIKVQEFISAKNSAYLISGDEDGNMGTTSKSTTDQVVAATRQPLSFTNYRRYPTEASLPYNEQADQMQNEPQKFYDFLKENGVEYTFEAYFVESKPNTKEGIKEIAKQKAIKMAEQILSQRRTNQDVIRKPESLPTIDEIKQKDNIIVSKLERIAEYCKTNMSDDERKVLLSHFNSLING